MQSTPLMQSWLEQICGTGFMPHGQCYLWTPQLIWLHAVSDSLIALAYFSIPLSLVYFVRRRRDVPFPRIFLMFGAFIVACGLTHALEVWTIWNSHYYFTGLVKAATAAISLATSVALFRVIPLALQFKGPEELRRLNATLEERVQQRTAELETANRALSAEIAERERAEAEVRQLNRQLANRLSELQALFDVLPVGVGIAEDSECRVIRMNQGLAQLLRLDHHRNASLSAPEGEAPTHFQVLHHSRVMRPEDLPMQTCARENRPIFGFAETILHADGTRLELLANAVPLRDASGRAVGCVATFQDVTALQQALTTNARYAAIIANSEDAIIAKNLDSIITDWNRGAEKIFGYPAAEAIGRSILMLFPPERIEEEAGIIERLSRGEAVPQFDSIRRRKDGRDIEVSVQISPIRDTDGRIVGASSSARDISQQREAERARREMERKLLETQKLESLGVLAGGIAHDFNNLLTGVLGNASLARTELPDSSNVLPLLGQIETSSRRAADLCRQLLAYAGRGRFVVQNLDLNQVITETTHLLNLSLSKTCVLRFNLAAALPAVSADATQVRQIVMNLVLNASEAIGERSGVVALTTGVARVDEDYRATLIHDNVPCGDYVFLEVSDNGCGMDRATLSRIFDPFFTTKFTGRGLGLAAVLGIVRGHQGALKVYSEPGSGSAFKLFFPAVSQPAEPARLAFGRAAPWRGAGCVLIVDDEETVRTIAARILEAAGFSVELANDGRDAVSKFRHDPSRYCMVLLDLTMPHLDGEETFRQLRHLHPAIRVVLMSGFNEQEAIGRFVGKGLAGFVQKPFEVDAMLATIREALLAR